MGITNSKLIFNHTLNCIHITLELVKFIKISSNNILLQRSGVYNFVHQEFRRDQISSGVYGHIYFFVMKERGGNDVTRPVRWWPNGERR